MYPPLSSTTDSMIRVLLLYRYKQQQQYAGTTPGTKYVLLVYDNIWYHRLLLLLVLLFRKLRAVSKRKLSVVDVGAVVGVVADVDACIMSILYSLRISIGVWGRAALGRYWRGSRRGFVSMGADNGKPALSRRASACSSRHERKRLGVVGAVC